jgi:hypothetical protein
MSSTVVLLVWHYYSTYLLFFYCLQLRLLLQLLQLLQSHTLHKHKQIKNNIPANALPTLWFQHTYNWLFCYYAQDNQQQGIWKQISVDMRTGPSSFLCCCLRNPCDGSGSGSGGCRSNNNLAVTQQKGIVTVPTVIQINCNTLSFFFFQFCWIEIIF